MERSTVRLSDLCNLVTEQVNPSDQPDAVYVGLEHITPGQFVRKGQGKASDVRSSKVAFKSGDILYGKLRPYLDKAVLAQDEGICTTELLILRNKAGVDPRFLAGVVHSPNFVEYAVAGTTGAQHPRTSWSHICTFSLLAFTPDEQKRIADILWLLHEGITASENSVETGKDLKRSAMHRLFTRGLRGEAQKETEIGPVPESWELCPLGTLCEKTDTVDPRREGERIIKYVDVSSVSREFLTIEGTARCTLREAPGRARKHILTGDVIFATVRPTLLRAAHIPATLNDQVCSTAFCVLRRNPKGVADKFLYYLVQRDRFIQQLAGIEHGASYPAVTDRIVKEQIVPVPSLEEQREIVTILDTIDRKIDLHRRKRAALDDLFKALLHKLMTGEIRVGELNLSALSPSAAPTFTLQNGRATFQKTLEGDQP